jgi:hypothetical protein
MNAPLPRIYRDCRRLLVHTEQAVRGFARYHKSTVGADLRRQAMAVMRPVHHAVSDKTRQAESAGWAKRSVPIVPSADGRAFGFAHPAGLFDLDRSATQVGGSACGPNHPRGRGNSACKRCLLRGFPLFETCALLRPRAVRIVLTPHWVLQGEICARRANWLAQARHAAARDRRMVITR